MSAPQLSVVNDHETRLMEDDHQSIKLWLRLLTCSSLIESYLRAQLREQFDTTLPRFDFMAQLERAPDGLTMGEISRRMMVTGGNVSGIASQLDREGLIKRTLVPGDRRTVKVKLTPKGQRSFSRMAAEHEQWIVGILGDLPKAEAETLMGLLQRVKANASSVIGADRDN